ncbi:16S rRNA (cytosine(967)-C(5))-methyltransferase RsmB [Laribacter hongkongensis]|nr:16S rRNA (cytosine(967)-C(5))-methyltransferase RsmB [Laribacter hongkongensis]MCG9031751.1 16S rRNA (cytosine(967)-C(5))-methyltransferase RsmB [Laribacter hongkongensis]MCG9055749.1 16S rRNA (cytosine(967)-C(5))-methyltransferase RsmB [Laribacter hongkongensis]MCG9064802.1 16S rRNA (cytosine(967)-C(5))-methyltransferase RsmB [Laribacter hongkongensis]MCG9091726.1 16S rRNA (cytosine(967)-C(5))-methyltransferase RsmB [Laribacter hongkongensis]MCG9106896.1 16S rRNA (cytosine(967)-C(5))-methy
MAVSFAMYQNQLLAARILDATLSGHNLTDVMSSEAAHITGDRRAQLLDLTHGSLRRYGRLRVKLDHLLERPLTDPVVDRLLIVALYQLEATRAAPYAIVDHAVRAASEAAPRLKGLVNAVLRNAQRRQDELEQLLQRDTVAHWNHPEWWIAAVRRAYPRDWKAVLGASNQHPPMTLRVNTRRVEPAEYLNELASHGHAATLLEDAAIKLVSPCPVSQLPGFFEGLCSVQDAGAQLATGLLDVADGMRVLDACAAPGGKTGHLLEARTLDLTALDADARRLARVSQNLERLGLHARVVRGDAATPAAWWDGRPFDRILADVPCSASGVVRRHPDIKWTRRSSDLNQFAQTQRRIADALWPLVASGGKMLYATCSIFPTENREQIDAFLARHADAALERDLQLVPDDTHDGFYYAVLVRR